MAPALALLACFALLIPSNSGDAAGVVPTQYINDTTDRPLGPITVIGDSVLLGALTYTPNLIDALADNGWGPIRARGGMGYSTGHLATPEWSRSSLWIRKWRDEGWDAPNVVVNLGVNDAGLCGGNHDCAVASIDHLLDEIGPGHTVWWANITRSAASGRDYQTSWNSALDEVAARRPELVVWNWAEAYTAGGFSSGDRIHLSPSGYRARNLLMATDITERLVPTEHSGPPVPLPTSSAGSPSGFTGLAPTRILDTRLTNQRQQAGGIVRVATAGFVPPGTTAIAVNVTTTGTSEPGFLTAFPCGDAAPDTSTVNHDAGTDRGALAMVGLSATGDICVLTAAAGHVIVDLQGAFSPEGSLRFSPLPEPQRLADTRLSRRAPAGTPLQVEVPSDADAVAVTITATDAEQPGFVTVHPCDGELPVVSSVNHGVEEPVAGAAIVSSDRSGRICVTSSSAVDIIVDLTGVFQEGTGHRFVPVAPTRLLDTRFGIGGWGPRHSRDARIELPVAPSNAVAVTGTITIVQPTAFGFLTVEPCNARSETSSVNATARGTMANLVSVGTTDGSICITSNASTHTLFDVTGWWVP